MIESYRDKLNEIDHKCINEDLHFYDLRSLFEAVAPKLSAQDKEEVKKVIQNTDDAETIAAVLMAKAKDDKNESLEEDTLDESLWDNYLIEFKDLDDGKIYSEEYEGYDRRDAIKLFRIDYPESDNYKILHVYKLTDEGWEETYYNYDESLEEKLVDAPQEVIDKLLEILEKHGFILDNSIEHENPSKSTLFGDIHIQVINPDSSINNDNELSVQEQLKNYISKELIDEIHNLDQEYNCPITWNFGPNNKGQVTGGLDIMKQYVEESFYPSFDEGLSNSNNKVFVVKYYNWHPFNGYVELMDKVDSNGEGEKHNFLNYEELNDFTKELIKQGYKNYQGYPHLNEASYGGAYDIEDDMYFTKDDMYDFLYELIDKLKDAFGYDFDIYDAGFDTPTDLYIELTDNTHDLITDNHVHIDMRKIKVPFDLNRKYLDSTFELFKNDFQDLYNEYNFDESLTECNKELNEYRTSSSNVDERVKKIIEKINYIQEKLNYYHDKGVRGSDFSLRSFMSKYLDKLVDDNTISRDIKKDIMSATYTGTADSLKGLSDFQLTLLERIIKNRTDELKKLSSRLKELKAEEKINPIKDKLNSMKKEIADKENQMYYAQHYGNDESGDWDTSDRLENEINKIKDEMRKIVAKYPELEYMLEESLNEAYSVRAYHSNNHRGLVDIFSSDDFDKIRDKAHDFLWQGCSIVIDDNETGKFFTINPDEYFDKFEGEGIQPHMFHESLDDTPYTYEQMESELKSATYNWKKDNFEGWVYYIDEFESAMQILSDHYENVDYLGHTSEGYGFLATRPSLFEDTVKQNGKWVNKGKEGTHGKFATKKQADAQRKAMFAQGYKAESLKESDENRYKPVKRLALDGKTWWVVWDNKENKYSTKMYHGKYKTRKEAELAIEYYNKKYDESLNEAYIDADKEVLDIIRSDKEYNSNAHVKSHTPDFSAIPVGTVITLKSLNKYHPEVQATIEKISDNNWKYVYSYGDGSWDRDLDNYGVMREIREVDNGAYESLNEAYKHLNNREKQVYIDIINNPEECEDIDDLKDIVHEIFFYDRALFAMLNKFPKDASFEELKANKISILKDSMLDESLKEAVTIQDVMNNKGVLKTNGFTITPGDHHHYYVYNIDLGIDREFTTLERAVNFVNRQLNNSDKLDTYFKDKELYKVENVPIDDSAADAQKFWRNTFKLNFKVIPDGRFDNYQTVTIIGTKNDLLRLISPNCEPDLFYEEDIVPFNKNIQVSIEEDYQHDKDEWGNPYSFDEVEKELKNITNNWTDKEGTIRCYWEQEKNYGLQILKKHYKYVDVSDGRTGHGEDMSWVLAYSEPKEKLDESFWFGKYTDLNKQIHKVYFEFDSSDFEEAEKEFDSIIPEPYVKATLSGRADEAGLQRDGFTKLNESLNESVRSNLQDKIIDCIDWFIMMEMEFPKDEFLADSWEDLKDGIEMGVDSEFEVAEGIVEYFKPIVTFNKRYNKEVEEEGVFQDEIELYKGLVRAMNNYLAKNGYEDRIKE